MKIKTNDNVRVMTGKYRGKTGKVLQVFVSDNKLVVEGMNIMKKHLRGRKAGEKGQILELSAPMPASNVQLVCSKCEKPTRVGYKIDGDTKRRVCAKCKALID